MKLVFTTNQMPGYMRIRRGKGFSYLLPDGGLLNDKAERMRISALSIPPAYEDVWICMLENGHLQATGKDARGRTQYCYHAAWHDEAADRKFGILCDFVTALPRIRARVRRELCVPYLTFDRVVAGIVALLDLTGYRIGNSKYARENRTFGISSLLTRHLKEEDGQLLLRFRGKAGHKHKTEIAAPRLARLISELHDLPGQNLFRYEDEQGEWHDVGSADVNRWLKEAGDGDYTAKQFRTWKATLICAIELATEPPADTKSARERVIRQAIKITALKLNHTAATCRKYYIHPRLTAAYRNGSLFQIMNSPPPRLRKSDGTASLHANERRVFKIISAADRKAGAICMRMKRLSR
jgi:DNA topoisomerase I